MCVKKVSEWFVRLVSNFPNLVYHPIPFRNGSVSKEEDVNNVEEASKK
ncbi:MAG: hypothetical protein IKW39_01290 [Alphaproteobacteria bacterium]|nr:hypothetical protein [Alphaproteobacteria bacterium]